MSKKKQVVLVAAVVAPLAIWLGFKLDTALGGALVASAFLGAAVYTFPE